MKKDNLYFEESRERISKGVEKVAKAVGNTMGTSGQNSVIQRFENPYFLLTNDGWTILDSIVLSDPLEEMGRNFLREAVQRANKNSGDGSSTTCVLTAAILKEGEKYIGKQSPMEIKRSLEDSIKDIEARMEAQTITITEDNVKAVASISAEDEEIGARIEEIYKKIGKDGIIQWETSKFPEDSYTIGTGIQIQDAGYVTPYLNDIDPATGQILQEAKMKDVPVMIIKEKITSGTAFNSIFSQMFDKGYKEVALFCDEITPEAVGHFIQTRGQRGFRIALIKLPVLWGPEWVEDISIATGAKVVSPATGLTILDMSMDDVGKAGNIVVKRDSVYMDGLQDMEKHILGLKVDGSNDAMLRVARLNLRTARYLVGGNSESAISYRRLKVEDAINAASEALDGGIVPGGGVALRNIADKIDNPILKVALRAPYETILKNAGITPDETQESEGYDTRTLKKVNMMENNIVDPKKVVLNATKAAISVAAGILTMGTVVLFPDRGVDGTYEVVEGIGARPKL